MACHASENTRAGDAGAHSSYFTIEYLVQTEARKSTAVLPAPFPVSGRPGAVRDRVLGRLGRTRDCGIRELVGFNTTVALRPTVQHGHREDYWQPNEGTRSAAKFMSGWSSASVWLSAVE